MPNPEEMMAIALSMKKGQTPKTYSREAARLADSMTEEQLTRNLSFDVYKWFGNLRRISPLLTQKSYEHDPLRAWEILFGRTKGVVPELRERMGKFGGVSGLF